MEKYFITKGTERKGPYSIEDLQKMELTDDYLIWKDGFKKWEPITEIAELKNNIIISPPPTPAQLKIKDKKATFITSLKTSGIWLLGLWIAIFLFMGGYKNNNDLQEMYGYGENAIYGGGGVIREGLFWTSFLISFAVSLIILFFVYRNKTKSNERAIQNENKQNNEQLS